jgi:hypothetical protein
MTIFDDLPAIQHGIEGVWSGIIATAPINGNAPVMVLVPGIDSQTRIGPCRWVKKGTDLPNRGDACLVVWDEQQKPYVIVWWSGAEGGIT